METSKRDPRKIWDDAGRSGEGCECFGDLHFSNERRLSFLRGEVLVGILNALNVSSDM